jgi:hypothetical protein
MSGGLTRPPKGRNGYRFGVLTRTIFENTNISLKLIEGRVSRSESVRESVRYKSIA